MADEEKVVGECEEKAEPAYSKCCCPLSLICFPLFIGLTGWNEVQIVCTGKMLKAAEAAVTRVGCDSRNAIPAGDNQLLYFDCPVTTSSLEEWTPAKVNTKAGKTIFTGFGDDLFNKKKGVGLELTAKVYQCKEEARKEGSSSASQVWKFQYKLGYYETLHPFSSFQKTSTTPNPATRAKKYCGIDDNPTAAELGAIHDLMGYQGLRMTKDTGIKAGVWPVPDEIIRNAAWSTVTLKGGSTSSSTSMSEPTPAPTAASSSARRRAPSSPTPAPTAATSSSARRRSRLLLSNASYPEDDAEEWSVANVTEDESETARGRRLSGRRRETPAPTAASSDRRRATPTPAPTASSSSSSGSSPTPAPTTPSPTPPPTPAPTQAPLCIPSATTKCKLSTYPRLVQKNPPANFKVIGNKLQNCEAGKATVGCVQVEAKSASLSHVSGLAAWSPNGGGRWEGWKPPDTWMCGWGVGSNTVRMKSFHASSQTFEQFMAEEKADLAAGKWIMRFIFVGCVIAAGYCFFSPLAYAGGMVNRMCDQCTCIPCLGHCLDLLGDAIEGAAVYITCGFAVMCATPLALLTISLVQLFSGVGLGLQVWGVAFLFWSCFCCCGCYGCLCGRARKKRAAKVEAYEEDDPKPEPA